MTTKHSEVSEADAADHMPRVWDEIARLRERFAQRPQAEKKRLGVLEHLHRKLKRLEKGGALKQPGHKGEALEPISADELALLKELTPAKKK